MLNFLRNLGNENNYILMEPFISNLLLNTPTMKKIFLILFVLVACQAQPTSSSSPNPPPKPPVKTTVTTGDAEPAAMKGMLAAHNKWRTELNLPPLAWSNELAVVAQKWANQLKRKGCKMEHSSNQFGENLYWSSGMGPTPEHVVNSWASERKYFNHQTKKCNGNWAKCGHYTQVIWKKTERVGCAKVTCGDEQVWVCNYDPPGNYTGIDPY